YSHEDIRDRIREYQMIDSTGFFIRPPQNRVPNNQPYDSFEGAIVPYTHIRAENHTKIDRFMGFLQWSHNTTIGKSKAWINAGLRAQTWIVSGEKINSTTQTIISPRVQFALKPNWDADMLFRLSGGVYDQAPFYKELRDSDGRVHPEVKAQKSIHVVLGNDYSFQMGGRPFKLTSEAYYKHMTDVNPYTIENVRIRYQAQNNATAYAYGLDLRLSGELV